MSLLLLFNPPAATTAPDVAVQLPSRVRTTLRIEATVRTTIQMPSRVRTTIRLVSWLPRR